MSYRFRILDDGDLLVVSFQGEITPKEELEALSSTGDLAGLHKNARVLVDRRGSSVTAAPKDVGPQVDRARKTFSTSALPRMAVVVDSDRDSGMLRMLEMSAQDQLPHDLKVFRNIDEACEWVGVKAADVDPGPIGANTL